jgi:hypothetical protein
MSYDGGMEKADSPGVVPGVGLLDREVSDRYVEDNLGEGTQALRHIIDEGVNIFDKLLKSGYVMDDVGRIIIGHLFSHFLALLDGAEILLSRGAAYAAKAQLRAMVETGASIAWILHENTEFRAKAYIVGYRRQLLQFVRDHMDDGSNDDELRSAVAQAQEGLAASAYAEVNQMFEEVHQKRRREPAWHAIGGGPKYMRQLIRDTELPNEVQFFWARYSSFSHGYTMDDHTILGDRRLRIAPLRDVAPVPGDTLTAGVMAYAIYKVICEFALEKHVPHLVRRFRRWLATIRNMPSITVRDIDED